ncbi:hypothetical protein [Acinetobacter bereziniae]|uniref:hypothetical protein n=1 Tax=Acinetobacter bereziniae TaxID=106648 RepID=UPI0021D096B2|nr:hypothetical protein [Acinetobacter bereziniae]MCU4599087.1 hypothetical protein [Acinetobacter bereziniae]
MNRLEILKQIKEVKLELKHLGSCTTIGLTDYEIAQLDERFFLAVEKIKKLKARRNNKPEGFR